MKKFRFDRMASAFGALFLCSLVFFEFTRVSECVQIWRLRIPDWVQNGTRYIVLDCEYWYNPQFDTDLMVSWFLNYELVYHWTPDRGERHAYGVLENRLDWNFSVRPDEPRQKYKALKILHPSPELSGQYICSVASRRRTAVMMKNMTVYVPPHKFKVSYKEKNESLINVTCEALGVFPEPMFKMFTESPTEERRQIVKDATAVSRLNVHDTYDAYFYRTYNVSDLIRKNISWFECSFELVGPRYYHRKRFPYPVPPHTFELSYNQTSDSTVHVLCEARGLFPFPNLFLLLETSSGNLRAQNATVSSELTIDYTYDADLCSTFSSDELVMNGVSGFICVMELEGISHSESKRVSYGDAEASQLSASLKPAISWYLLTASIVCTYLCNISFDHSLFKKVEKRMLFLRNKETQ